MLPRAMLPPAAALWLLVQLLDDAQLDGVGNHPVLGEFSLETMLISIYGHQLFHMRDAQEKNLARRKDFT